MPNTMNANNKFTSKYVTTIIFFATVFFVNMVSAAESSVQSSEDQMVCHVTKINHAMDSAYTSKNVFKCVKRSSRRTHGYNNLAEIYSEGWSVVSINNDNLWLLSRTD